MHAHVVIVIMCIYFCDIIYRACFVHVWHAHMCAHLEHRCVESFIGECDV